MSDSIGQTHNYSPLVHLIIVNESPQSNQQEARKLINGMWPDVHLNS